MKILLAGPGTGKTTKIKSIIAQDYPDVENIQVISFTKATVDDLTQSFDAFNNVSCDTLHGFAFRINPLQNLAVITTKDEKEYLKLSANKLGITFDEICTALECITYDKMITECIYFLQNNPAYADATIGSTDLLIVDEFQDFNSGEQQLVMELSKLSKETIILGDDDQSIYGFKDADPEGIINLYNDTNVEKLHHDNICWRCPDAVVEDCSLLLSKNRKRVSKEWKPSGKQGSVFRKQFKTMNETDSYVCDAISEIKKTEPEATILILSPLEIAVNSLKARLAERHREDIVDCWVEKVGKDVLHKAWWMSLIFGKSNKMLYTLFLLRYYQKFNNIKPLRVYESFIQSGGNEDIFTKQIAALKLLPEPFNGYLSQAPSIGEFFTNHADYAELFERISDWSEPEEVVAKLLDLLKEDSPFERGKINLMSIHKSKGLQADYVFIVGLVHGILPNTTKHGKDSEEAQRRLLFVGMTRALKSLYLLSTIEWDLQSLRSNNAEVGQFVRRGPGGMMWGRTTDFLIDIIKQKK